MLSFSSRQKLKELLVEIGKQEKQLEVLRQILCEQAEFEPYAAFRRTDRMRRGFLTATDIMEFLFHNGFKHEEYECGYFINHYDRDRDGHLVYGEFLPALLPLDNTELRTIATQRRVYDVAFDEYLVYEVEYALARLISREIVYYIELDELKAEVVNQYDFSFYDAYASVDVYESGFIDFNLLRNFLKATGKIAKDDDVIAILRRIDRDDDGRISYEDFVEAVQPQRAEIRHDRERFTAGLGLTKSLKSPRRVKSPEKYEAIISRKSATRIRSPVKTYASPKKELFKETVSPRKITSPGYKTKENFSSTVAFGRTVKDTRNNYNTTGASRRLSITGGKEKRPSSLKNSRGSLREIVDISAELVRVLREMINLEREVELAKQDLALRSDYNVLDTFRLFDRKGKGMLSPGEIEEAFNELGIFPNKEDLYLFIRRFDRDNDGRLRFTDFSDGFTPLQPEYYKLIKSRTPINGDLFFDPNTLFSAQTKRLLKDLLILHLENEAVIEALRQKLNHNALFHIRSAFESLDNDGDGYVTLYELRVAMDRYNNYATEKELSYLISRFDKNDDSKISYAEFVQEMTPRSHKKY